ncbi:hypothetical protein C8Q74DRAFT_103170 [Fomes fomentarius]|nr:hypothetical protein C8Q74DRAFT_103170 [Fomes fomentarius]
MRLSCGLGLVKLVSLAVAYYVGSSGAYWDGCSACCMSMEFLKIPVVLSSEFFLAFRYQFYRQEQVEVDWSPNHELGKRSTGHRHSTESQCLPCIRAQATS